MPGVRSVTPSKSASDTASIRAWTRMRCAKSSCMGPNSTRRLSSPLRRKVTSPSLARMPPSTMSGRGEPSTFTGAKRTVSPGLNWPSFQRS